MFGATEIGNPDAGRVCLAAGTPHGNDATLVASAVSDQPGLGAKTVNAVDDVSKIFCHQGVQVFNGEEILNGRYLACRIDLQHTLGHHLYLGHAQGAGQCVQLTVDIGLGDMVQVDQCQLANGAACQCFGRPRAHATDTQHTDMCLPESCQCLLAIESANAGEAAFEVRVSCVHGMKTYQKTPVFDGASAYNVVMELIDSHCHLDVAAFDADRQAVLDRARKHAVVGVVVPGIQASGWKTLLTLCNDAAGLYPALGLHPVFLEQHRPADLQLLEAELAVQQPVAVGEIGLDFQVDGLDHERQQQLFEAQLQLAGTAGLPVILHVRKAHDQVLATLRRINVRGGICHAFNGSLQQASQYSDLGFRFGFGGMLTFERSTRLRVLARALPLESMVLETDAPDMTVFQHHGERNSPEYLPYCLAALAAVRDEDPEEVARVTTANTREVLSLDDD